MGKGRYRTEGEEERAHSARLLVRIAPLAACPEISTLELRDNGIAEMASLAPLRGLRSLRSLLLSPWRVRRPQDS